MLKTDCAAKRGSWRIGLPYFGPPGWGRKVGVLTELHATPPSSSIVFEVGVDVAANLTLHFQLAEKPKALAAMTMGDVMDYLARVSVAFSREVTWMKEAPTFLLSEETERGQVPGFSLVLPPRVSLVFESDGLTTLLGLEEYVEEIDDDGKFYILNVSDGVKTLVHSERSLSTPSMKVSEAIGFLSTFGVDERELTEKMKDIIKKKFKMTIRLYRPKPDRDANAAFAGKEIALNEDPHAFASDVQEHLQDLLEEADVKSRMLEVRTSRDLELEVSLPPDTHADVSVILTFSAETAATLDAPRKLELNGERPSKRMGTVPDPSRNVLISMLPLVLTSTSAVGGGNAAVVKSEEKSVAAAVWGRKEAQITNARPLRLREGTGELTLEIRGIGMEPKPLKESAIVHAVLTVLDEDEEVL